MEGGVAGAEADSVNWDPVGLRVMAAVCHGCFLGMFFLPRMNTDWHG